MTNIDPSPGVTAPRRMNSPTLKKKPLEQGSAHFLRAIDTRAVNLGSIYSLAASLSIYLAFNFAVNSGQDASSSFYLAVTGGLLALAPLVVSEAGRELGRGKLGLFLLSVYAFKTIASVAHFLVYIQPDYFNGNADFSYFWDYMWLDQSLTFVADTWHVGGLFSPIGAEYWQENKNAGLLAFMSLSYYVAGSHPLSIVPWNVLISIYSAILIADITKSYGGGKRHISLALWIAALFPFGFIGSLMWRDTTGQFLIVLGTQLLVLNQKRKYICLLLIPVASFLGYLHREPYLLVFFVAAAIYAMNQIRLSKQGFFLAPACLLLLIASVPLAKNISSLALDRYSAADSGAVESMTSFGRVIGLPIRLIRAILGPFPWTQYFKKVDGYAYQPFDYLQSVLNLALLVCVLPVAWRLWQVKKQLDISTLLALLFFAIAIVSTGIHSGYVSMGMILLIPLATHVGKDHFLKVLLGSLCFFLGANILVVGAGFSGLNLLQNISGGY